MRNDYQGLTLRLEDGVLEVVIRGRDRVNSLDENDHHELTSLWLDADQDPAVRVIVITGEGDYFSAGGNMAMEQRIAGDFASVRGQMEDARGLVRNIVACRKPIVSAINGPAAGAGLAVALLADISIVGEDVAITDGHTRIGIAAGDHAVLIWPLLCGMARAKRYLLTADRIDGRTAAEIGLVSWSAPTAEVLAEAMSVAGRLARGPQDAIQWTKRSLNHWLTSAMPAFEASLALEMLGLLGPDYAEGVSAFVERRAPDFE